MIALKPITNHPLFKIIIFGVATLASAMLLVPIYFFNPIVHKAFGIISLILISIILLKTEGRYLNSIGVKLNFQSFNFLAVGTLLGIGMGIITILLTKGLVRFNWDLNPKVSIAGVLIILNFYFWSALVEELWFRGYGFQRLAEYKGKWVAFFSVGLLFGLYHINTAMPILEILITIFTTGIKHVFYGLAILKFRNLALPLGLHLGYNFAQELLPRHTSLNTENSFLHVVSTDALKFTPISLLLPYFSIVILGCLLLFFYKK